MYRTAKDRARMGCIFVLPYIREHHKEALTISNLASYSTRTAHTRSVLGPQLLLYVPLLYLILPIYDTDCLRTTQRNMAFKTSQYSTMCIVLCSVYSATLSRAWTGCILETCCCWVFRWCEGKLVETRSCLNGWFRRHAREENMCCFLIL